MNIKAKIMTTEEIQNFNKIMLYETLSIFSWLHLTFRPALLFAAYKHTLILVRSVDLNIKKEMQMEKMIHMLDSGYL